MTTQDALQRISVVDTHTAGEPTRVVVSGGPVLAGASMAERRDTLRRQHDGLRSAVVNEPRGSNMLVGAWVCPPIDPACTAGVIFFNNVGLLGMCGHGTMGLAVALAHLGRIGIGSHRVETPVGSVGMELLDAHTAAVVNVPSYRHARAVAIEVAGIGTIHGDVAWGGNWFFLVHDHGLNMGMDNLDELTEFSWRVREELAANGITGKDGGEIDHVELFGPTAGGDSQSFVLCPGKAYDRSPCGTGTSAKLACLYADGKLEPGQVWRQQSVVGSIFEGVVEIADGQVIPTITGDAWVMAEGELLVDERDPFKDGIST